MRQYTSKSNILIQVRRIINLNNDNFFRADCVNLKSPYIHNYQIFLIYSALWDVNEKRWTVNRKWIIMPKKKSPKNWRFYKNKLKIKELQILFQL